MLFSPVKIAELSGILPMQMKKRIINYSHPINLMRKTHIINIFWPLNKILKTLVNSISFIVEYKLQGNFIQALILFFFIIINYVNASLVFTRSLDIRITRKRALLVPASFFISNYSAPKISLHFCTKNHAIEMTILQKQYCVKEYKFSLLILKNDVKKVFFCSKKKKKQAVLISGT